MGDERHVDRIPLPRAGAGLVLETGAGEKVDPAFVQRDGQDPVGIIKCLLHTIAMVSVDVQVGHPPPPFHQPLDCKYGIVQVGKAGCPGTMGVMPASGQVEGDVEPFLLHQAHRLKSSPGPQSGTVVQSLEHRAVGITQAITEIGTMTVRGAEFFQSTDVGRIVIGVDQSVIDRAAGADLHAGQLQQPVGLHQVVGHAVALQLEGVIVAVAEVAEER